MIFIDRNINYCPPLTVIFLSFICYVIIFILNLRNMFKEGVLTVAPPLPHVIYTSWLVYDTCSLLDHYMSTSACLLTHSKNIFSQPTNRNRKDKQTDKQTKQWIYEDRKGWLWWEEHGLLPWKKLINGSVNCKL